MKLSEVQKTVWKLCHTTIALMMLGVIGMFVYEKNVVQFDDFVELVSIVPSDSEFEHTAYLQFYVFAGVEKDQSVDLRQNLICDNGDGTGYRTVASQNKEIDVIAYNNDDVVVAKTLLENSTETLSFAQINDRLRNIIEASSISTTIVYDSVLPQSTSQCFMKFTLTKETEHFKVAKTQEFQSYPFDYVIYYDYRSHGRKLSN